MTKIQINTKLQEIFKTRCSKSVLLSLRKNHPTVPYRAVKVAVNKSVCTNLFFL